MGKHYTNVSARGKFINARGFSQDENGTVRRFSERCEFQPTLFTHVDQETGYRDIYGQNCLPKMFDTMPDARRMLRESAVPVLGQEDFALQWINQNYKQHGTPNLENVRTSFLDIEVWAETFPIPDKAAWPVSCFTMYNTHEAKFHLWSTKRWNKSESELPQEILDCVEFKQFDTEKAMLTAWILHMRHEQIDIITGWNSEGFDLPYMVNRIRHILGQGALDKVAPFGFINERNVTTKYGDEKFYSIGGISHLDYLALYKKFTFTPRPNYKLNTIAEAEGVAGKLDFDGSLYDLWETDPQLYMDYNIQDVVIMLDLDKKLNLLRLVQSLAYYAGVNYESVLSPIKTWDAIIFNSLVEQKLVLPPNKIGRAETFEGAYVVPTKPGLWDWIVSFDLTSLYPSVIRLLNISPETIAGDIEPLEMMDWVNKKAPSACEQTGGDYALAPCGRYYSRDLQGVIPREIAKVFFQRKENKAESKKAERKAAELKGDPSKVEEYQYYLKRAKDYDIEQHNRKILVNSLYGALGSAYFRFYDSMNALAVTSMGQLANRWMMRKLNEWISKEVGEDRDWCIAGDTDSVYLTLDKYVQTKLVPRLGTDKVRLTAALNKIINAKIQPFINEFYEELFEYVNGRENTLDADREVIAPIGVYVAKKRYFLDVRDNEGTVIPEGKLKITGLETQQGGTPPWVRGILKECYWKILQRQEDELHDFVNAKKIEYLQQSIYDIAKVKTVNNISKYTDANGYPIKGCPGGPKAASAYNRVATRYGVEPIGDGDKACLIDLKIPNAIEPGNSSLPTFAWPSGDKLPPELEELLNKYTNKEIQLEKTFMEPLWSVLDACSWSREQETSLDSFF